MAHFICSCGTDHPTRGGRHICSWEHRKENRGKAVIPNEIRRRVAVKYGCPPGENLEVACHYCGEPGMICWTRTTRNRPSSWVCFSLEMDHLHPESRGGEASEENIVLACRSCNRSKGMKSVIEFSERNGTASRKEAPPLLPRHLVRQIEKLPAAARTAIRTARLAVVQGADPEAVVRRLVYEHGVPLPLALSVFPEGIR